MLGRGHEISLHTITGIMSGKDFLYAAKEGSMEKFRALVRQGGVDINYQDEDLGMTALMFAALGGYGEMIRELLEMGADSSLVNYMGHTALVQALHHPDVATMLVESGCSMDYSDPQGRSLLHLACPDAFGEGESELLKVAKMYLDKGVDVDAIDAKGNTPLHLASGCGRIAFMALLIRRGAKINAQNQDGVTPLMVAVVNRKLSSIRILHNKGANALLPMENTESMNLKSTLPLEDAAGYGSLELVRELVELFGIKGCGGPSGGVGALAEATAAGHVDIVTLLLDNDVVDTGEALFIANDQGNLAIMRLLVQRRWGDSDYVDGVGCDGKWLSGEDPQPFHTPLACHFALCRAFSPRCAHLLIEAGASTQFFDAGPRAPPINVTLIGMLNFWLRKKTTGTGATATQQQLYVLVALRRLILRADAVTASSWLWPTAKNTEDKKKMSADLSGTMAILRRRAGRPGLVVFSSIKSRVRGGWGADGCAESV